MKPMTKLHKPAAGWVQSFYKETQQYKLAGNGQSVNVVAAIFKKLFALNAKGEQR